jgi:hypothetical protein
MSGKNAKLLRQTQRALGIEKPEPRRPEAVRVDHRGRRELERAGNRRRREVKALYRGSTVPNAVGLHLAYEAQEDTRYDEAMILGQRKGRIVVLETPLPGAMIHVVGDDGELEQLPVTDVKAARS